MIGREDTGTVSTNHMRAFSPVFSKAETGTGSGRVVFAVGIIVTVFAVGIVVIITTVVGIPIHAKVCVNLVQYSWSNSVVFHVSKYIVPYLR